MNNEIVSLQCPNCGGSLSVSNVLTSYKCEFCGMDHQVKHGEHGISLESYARCPVCNRNDKAEKVSSIIRSQVKETETVTYQTKVTYKQVGTKMEPVEEKVAVPIKSVESTDLAKQLSPPLEKPSMDPPPNPKAGCSSWSLGCSIVLFLIGISLFIIFSYLSINPLLSERVDAAGIFAAVMMVVVTGVISLIPIVAGILIIKKVRPREIEKANKKRIDAENEIKSYNEKVHVTNQVWEMAMDRYERLYYCQRDDCVFIPGENTSSPINNLKEYLFSKPI